MRKVRGGGWVAFFLPFAPRPGFAHALCSRAPFCGFGWFWCFFILLVVATSRRIAPCGAVLFCVLCWVRWSGQVYRAVVNNLGSFGWGLLVGGVSVAALAAASYLLVLARRREKNSRVGRRHARGQVVAGGWGRCSGSNWTRGAFASLLLVQVRWSGASASELSARLRRGTNPSSSNRVATIPPFCFTSGFGRRAFPSIRPARR